MKANGDAQRTKKQSEVQERRECTKEGKRASDEKRRERKT